MFLLSTPLFYSTSITVNTKHFRATNCPRSKQQCPHSRSDCSPYRRSIDRDTPWGRTLPPSRSKTLCRNADLARCGCRWGCTGSRSRCTRPLRVTCSSCSFRPSAVPRRIGTSSARCRGTGSTCRTPSSRESRPGSRDHWTGDTVYASTRRYSRPCTSPRSRCNAVLGRTLSRQPIQRSTAQTYHMTWNGAAWTGRMGDRDRWWLWWPRRQRHRPRDRRWLLERRKKGFLAKIRSFNSMVVLRFMLDKQLVPLEVWSVTEDQWIWGRGVGAYIGLAFLSVVYSPIQHECPIDWLASQANKLNWFDNNWKIGWPHRLGWVGGSHNA